MSIKEQALELIEKLLGEQKITVKEASTLIQAVNEGCNKQGQPNTYPSNVPFVPTPQPIYPGFPIVWCQGGSTGQNPQQWNTTIC